MPERRESLKKGLRRLFMKRRKNVIYYKLYFKIGHGILFLVASEDTSSIAKRIEANKNVKQAVDKE